MNTFSVVSRVLVVTAVVLSGSVSASYSEKINAAVNANKFTIAFATMSSLGCKKDEHAKKASINMIGRQIDRIEASEPLSLSNVAYYGVGDYLVGVAGEQLNKRGISVDAAVEQCDGLTESYYIRDGVKFLVKTTGNVVTNPQMILYLLSYIPGIGDSLYEMATSPSKTVKSDSL